MENKSKPRAIALQYQESSEKPEVVAQGSGTLAQQILKLAQQHNIPIHEDANLVEVLSKVSVGSTIPSETFQIVSEILCFLYQVDAEWGLEQRKIS